MEPCVCDAALCWPGRGLWACRGSDGGACRTRPGGTALIGVVGLPRPTACSRPDCGLWSRVQPGASNPEKLNARVGHFLWPWKLWAWVSTGDDVSPRAHLTESGRRFWFQLGGRRCYWHLVADQDLKLSRSAQDGPTAGHYPVPGVCPAEAGNPAFEPVAVLVEGDSGWS